MPDSQTPLYFHGCVSMLGEPNRLYRVYLLPRELIFIWAGSGGEMSLLTGRMNPQTNSRLQQLDNTPLEKLIGDHKHNFRAGSAARPISAASLDPSSLWHTIVFGLGRKHAGLFRFTVKDRGRFVLEIPTVEEMRLAVEHLPAILGPVLRVHVQWDESRKKFIAKPAANKS